MCFTLLYFASTFLFYYYDYFSHFALDEIDHLRIKGNESSNPSCRFNYKKDHHAAVQGASLPVLFFNNEKSSGFITLPRGNQSKHSYKQ
jgi:hypothetical protein